MCRLLGYAGVPVALHELLYAPEFSLERQSYEPRMQDVGRVNADGWGVAWYDGSVRPEPARYRTATPMWADRRFADIAPFLSSRHVVAAVRNASAGAPVEETGNAPFVSGPYAFAHNGVVHGFRDGLGVALRRGLSERRDGEVTGAADSEVVFAMVLDRLDKGATMQGALRDVVTELTELTTGRFNFLLSDGSTLVATRVANSLFTREARGGAARATYVVSEPLDDGPGWDEVPEHSIVTVTAGTVEVAPL